jgi:glycosyltransferase involved in cell wall biosynthesis
MKKIYINRRPVEGPWGGGNLFVKSMYEFFPKNGYKIIDNPDKEQPDIIFLQSPYPDNILNFSINDAVNIKQKNKTTKIYLRVNDCDARKGTEGVDDIWLETSKFVDKTFFVSNWMKNYFLEKGWNCKNNYVIYNGVNKDHFKPGKKINNEKINIVTHHWSSNRMKGFDAYEFIDNFVAKNKKYTFTYIGRELGTFKNTNVIKPLFGKDLGKELSKYDVYVSGSKFDPGPNHILESISCNLPVIVCKDGGGAVEFTNKNIYNNLEELQSMILSKQYETASDFTTSWKECILRYLVNF